MNSSYIYRHLKPNGEVFYIGIGKGLDFKRARTSKGRNIFWHRIVEKYGYEVQILKQSITREEAFELEKMLISWYGRRDNRTGILCNLTDGGEGTINWTPTEETKRKISESHKGKEGLKGELNPMFGKTGELHPSFGVKRSEETGNKIREAVKGRKAHNKGIPMTEEQKNNLSKIVLDTQTGVFYDCVKEAAETFSINKGTLICWLNGRRPNKSSLKYV